jgi:hypothetical protein
VPRAVDGSVPEQRVLEQSVRLPVGGAVTGWAACRLLGAAFFDGLEPDGRTPIPVPLAIGPTGNIRADDALSISRETLGPEEVLLRHGIPCTCELRALFDEMRRGSDLREAVVDIEAMAAAELVSVKRMGDYVDARPGCKRVQQVRDALELADEGSRSPNETRMRLVWQLDAGFPRPLVNQHVWDLRGRLLGIADLFDPVAGVVGEYDGADHRTAGRHSRDVDREARFRDRGLEVFRVTGPDLWDRPRVVRRMAAARARARWLPPGQRGWTVVPPPGLGPDPTLDEILEEREARSAVYARWEREGVPDLRELTRM